MRKEVLCSVFAIILMAMWSSCESNMVDVSQENREATAINREFVTLKSGIVVEQRDGQYIWQEDIVLSEAQFSLLDKTGDIVQNEQEVLDTLNTVRVSPGSGYRFIPNSESVNLRSSANYPTAYNLWAMVRFTYAKSGTGTTLNYYTKILIQQALAHWEANTNVRFYNATNEPTVDPTYGFAYPYVNFCDGSSNQSNVGRIGGRQDLTLVPWGCDVGTVIHEIGHAIGLFHEQCRFDRDNYITIQTSNIYPEKLHNFTKRTSNYYCIGGFDFNSIMLYPSYTTDANFAINTSLPIITKTDGSAYTSQDDVLSALDRRFPNTFYIPYIARSDVYQELDDISI
jgi:hypothetical protein